MKSFLRTTRVGGVMFLVPVALLLLVLRHAMQLAGWVAIFLPASPTPMSGNILCVQACEVRPLEIGMPAAMKLIKGVGIGSADVLRAVDLSATREP